jgi:hypothetical protein
MANYTAVIVTIIVGRRSNIAVIVGAAAGGVEIISVAVKELEEHGARGSLSISPTRMPLLI